MANPKHFKFAGSKKNLQNIPDYADYQPDLDIDFDDPSDQFEAYEKDIPEPTTHGRGTIKWFNAFGVRDKKSKKDVDKNIVEYTVTLHRLPAGKTLFYLDTDGAHEVESLQDAGNGRVSFTLSIGDPPTGAFP